MVLNPAPPPVKLKHLIEYPCDWIRVFVRCFLIGIKSGFFVRFLSDIVTGRKTHGLFEDVGEVERVFVA